MMTVTLLGTGGTQPLPHRALAALAVSVGGGTVLLDCGEGTQTALRRWGVSAYRLTHVLLTHYHGDHILGLPGLLQTLSSLGRTAPLTVTGPAGLEAVAAPMAALAGPLPFAVHWQQAGTLSGGEQQMLAVGRALMARPKLMMMDEPSLGLAPLVVKDIFAIIRRLKDEGMTILLIEQNANTALRCADYAYVLQTGSITMQGTGEQLLADPRVREAYLGGAKK